MTQFLTQLWAAVNDERCADWIRWNDAGNGFIIPAVSPFEANVLPMYYKHNRYSSFLRSLSYYSFVKVSNPDAAAEYTHPQFRRGHPEDLSRVRSSNLDLQQYCVRAGALCLICCR